MNLVRSISAMTNRPTLLGLSTGQPFVGCHDHHRDPALGPRGNPVALGQDLQLENKHATITPLLSSLTEKPAWLLVETPDS